MQYNLDKIKEIAIEFLYMDIDKTSFEAIATHPFTNTWVSIINNELIDLHDKDNCQKWRTYLSDRINKSEDVFQILCLMNRPYVLTLTKYIYSYLNPQILGEILHTFWKLTEAPHKNPNVSPAEFRKMFQVADKNTLMTKDELEIYNNLPDTFIVYRGVTNHNKDIKNPLSWTKNKQQALWFSKRFDESGQLLQKKISKSDVLCYFESEDEIII